VGCLEVQKFHLKLGRSKIFTICLYRAGSPIIYGDYFFTEAVLKLKGNEYLF